jgi:hypothetical protein
MITIKRHANLDNWINILRFNKVIEQTTSRAKALRIATAKAKKFNEVLVDADEGVIHHRHA